MSLFKKVDLVNESENAKIGRDFTKHINDIHKVDYFPTKEKEELLLRQQQHFIDSMGNVTPRPCVTFSPSGVSKCPYELYLKGLGYIPESYKFPYHRRWTRNASAVHEYMQKDLLYAEDILINSKFKVKRLDNGLPAWEHNLKTLVKYEYNGCELALSGMMDGILLYGDREIGFEYKTKSTTLAAVGDYKLKEIDPSHKLQATAYSLMFGLDTYIFMYESLAKDGWTKNELAKPDFKVFVHTVTEEDRLALLDKLSQVVHSIEGDLVVDKDYGKCLFCQFKKLCQTSNV